MTTSFKMSLLQLQSQNNKKMLIYYYNNCACLKTIDCIDFFNCVNLVKKLLSQFNLHETGHKYIVLYTNNILYLPVVISACIMMDLPFICLDTEADVQHTITIMDNITVGAVFSTVGEFNSLGKCLSAGESCVIKDPSRLYQLDLWDTTLCLWPTGKPGKTKCKKMMYAVQTSGSTGEPKIVQVPEESILPNITQLRSEWNVTENDVVLLVTPPTFDPFLVELLLALSCGAALLVVSSNTRASPHHLLDTVFPLDVSSLVTIAQFTPSVLARWSPEQIRSRVLNSQSSLRVLALGGERLPNVEWWKACRAPGNKTRLCSLYGTTELSCWAMSGSALDSTLGSPMSLTLLRVEDENNEPVKDGEGQLFIGSKIRICLVDNEQWGHLQPPVFRATGDLVSVKDGVYKYVGRMDNTVKRWGHRVCMEQIEMLAAECTEVAAACCVMHADSLGLFVVLHENSPPIQVVREKLKRFLVQKLNKASMPDIIFQQDLLPITRHGKTNRKKLKLLLTDLLFAELSSSNPSDLFKYLWSKYTCGDIESEMGFVSAGGNSISAMQIVNCMTACDVTRTVATTVMTAMLNNKKFAECIDVLLACGSTDTEVSRSGHVITGQTAEKKSACLQDQISYVHMKGISAQLLGQLAECCELNENWHYNLGKCVDASATCVVYTSGKSVLVIGSHAGRLAALELVSGTIVWDIQLPDRIESSLSVSEDGLLGLIGCYDGVVYCVGLLDGSNTWSFKTQSMVKGTALLLGDSWVFGSYDYHVYCVNITGGQLVWRYRMDGPVLATPLLVAGLVVVASLSGQVAALHRSSGSMAWLTSFSSPIFSTPCLVNSLLLVAEVVGHLHALCSSTGTEVWKFKARGEVFSTLVAFMDIVVFGCHDNYLYCVRCYQTAGQLLWTVNMGSPVYATPCFLTAHHLVVAATAGLVAIVDVTSGDTVCTRQLPYQIFSSPVVFKNFVVVGCRDDHVYCFVINKK